MGPTVPNTTVPRTQSHTHSPTHTVPRTQSHTHSPTHTVPHTQSHTHSPTHTVPHTQSHTHSPTHTVPHTQSHTQTPPRSTSLRRGGNSHAAAAPLRRFDHEKLRKVTQIVTRNLNRVIDVNCYPTEESRKANLRHRPLGVGIQGLADVFFKMRLPYTSLDAQQLNQDIFETIYFGALEASCDLAEAHGPYESYDGCPVSKGVLQFDMWGISPKSGRC